MPARKRGFWTSSSSAASSSTRARRIKGGIPAPRTTIGRLRASLTSFRVLETNCSTVTVFNFMAHLQEIVGDGGFWQHSQDQSFVVVYIIQYAELANSQTILWRLNAAKAFDSSFADSGGIGRQ